jgi:hypothetical protein
VEAFTASHSAINPDAIHFDARAAGKSAVRWIAIRRASSRTTPREIFESDCGASY